ncbi:PXA domain-containing protein [Chlamydoabsidia padenii]|nr:PXA domain-containing protein [Chlamydoabsidia padenii]
MISSLYSTKRILFILFLLYTVTEYHWTYTLYILRLGFLLVWGLLLLNLLVLFIYVKYFISPTRIGQDSRNKLDLEDFRPLRFTQSWSRLEQQRQQENDPHSAPLCHDNEPISAAFDELVSYVIRDFIQSWFTNVATPNELSFPLAVDRLIRSAASALKHRLAQVDTMSLILNRLVPCITAHLSEFRAAEVALRGRFLERSVTESDELDILLASHYLGGKLHPALTTAAVTTKPTEVAYLRQVMDRMLPKLVGSDRLGCAPVRVIVREIATCALLQPIMNMLADPDFWNQTIDTQKRHNFGSSRMGRRTFQEFLKMIEEEKNLLDLKRVRNDVVTQIRKKKALILDRDPEEVVDGEKVDDLMVYVNRLGVAKKRVDKRIATLSGEHVDFKTSASQFFGVRKQRSNQLPQISGFTLQDILTNTAGLSYFMEFMDRRGDMVKLQFWLTVEGFRSSDNDGAKRDDYTFLQDVKMVYDMYFATASPHRLSITEHLDKDLLQSIQHAQQWVADGVDTIQCNQAIQQMREQLYRIQQHVLWQLEKEHFPYFKRSDLYFKFLASSPTPDLPTPGRRSMDDTTLYRRSSSVDQKHHHRPSSHGSKPHYHHQDDSSSTSTLVQGMERSLSARMTTKRTPSWTRRDSSQKAESDTEINPRPSGDSGSNNFGNTNTDTTHQRTHARTYSDTGHGGASRFLSFGRVFGSANDWWRAADTSHQQTEKATSIKRNSIQGSVKSTDTEYPDTDEDLTTSPPAPRNFLRRNTVDAVEAELQSIIDGKENGNRYEQDTSSASASSPPPVPSTTRPNSYSSTTSTSSLRSPTILLGGTGIHIKSSTADPVEMANPVPSWTSATSDNQVRHDELEPTPHRPKGKGVETESTMDSETDNIKNVHLAPPGDLMLSDKVEKLSEEMEKLTQQESIVDALIKKAELKDKVEELRILMKGKIMLRRDLEQMQYQKSQYELQESENVLTPERTKVSITSSTIGSDQHSDFALYVIEIQQVGFDGNYASGWIVARRYSEFFGLHQKLKSAYPSVKLIDFPAKWPLLKLQKSFVEARRINLERYLKRLLKHPDICQSEALRIFLSQQNIFVPGPSHPVENGDGSSFGYLPFMPAPTSSSSTSSIVSSSSPSARHYLHRSLEDTDKKKGFMRHIYNTVAAGIDDMFVTPSMLDLITQRLGEQVIGFSNDDDTEFTPQRTPPNSAKYDRKQPPIDDYLSSSDLGESDLKNVDVEVMTRFTEPLCDLFIEMFELKEKNNWLRRQAVMIILQQILGGAIERKLRETVNYLSNESMVVYYFRKIMDSLWPGGATLTFKPARKQDEKLHTKEEANRKLSTWLPDLLGNMVGRQNARKGARRLFSVLQNQRLNQHLAYVLLDEMVMALFPDLDDPHKL